MGNYHGNLQNPLRKFFLAATVVMTLEVFSVQTTPWVRTQGPADQSPTDAGADRPTFDAASIKVNKSDEGIGNIHTLGELYKANHATLRTLIGASYFQNFGSRRFIFKGPAWIDSEHFDIEARAVGNPSKEKMKLMVRSLLEDRFKLAVHHETRQLPIYALVVSKSGKIGPQLLPHSNAAKCTDSAGGSPPPPPRAGESTPAYCGGFFMIPDPGDLRESGNEITMAMLAAFLNESVERPVVDQTGLSGDYDFNLEYAPEAGPGSQSDSDTNAPARSTQPSLFSALQEQLGLKLKPQKGPVEVLVIDHVEEPSPN